jgi:hypothetical protein
MIGGLSEVPRRRMAMARVSIAFVLCLAGYTQERVPEPDVKEQDAARKRIREIFKDDYAKKAPSDVQALAKKLLKQGQENKADFPLTFVLLREAREKAIEALDPLIALEAIEVASRTFVIPVIQQKGEALDRIQRRTTSAEALDVLLSSYLAVVAEAVSVDRYEEALQLFPGAEAVAARVDPLCAAELKTRKKDVDAIGREYKAVKKHVDALKQNAEDAEANVVVGRFLCFVRNDFKAGIPLLAKGSDKTLQVLAEAELGQLSDAVSFAEIGDRWYELAKGYSGGKFEKRFQDRAFFWYDRAWPKMAGLDRVELDKRLNEREERFGKVNLLRLIDPERDAKPFLQSPSTPYFWSTQQGVLIPKTAGGMSMLEVPYQLPPDYDLEIALEFLGNRGSDLFYLFPPSAEGRCLGFQGGWENGTHRVGDTSKVLEIPGAGEKGRLTSRLPLFKSGKPAVILLSCRGGSLTVLWENRVVLQAQGKFSPTKGGTLSLGCYSSAYRIHSLKLSPPGKRLR